jgi:hypothetical protein
MPCNLVCRAFFYAVLLIENNIGLIRKNIAQIKEFLNKLVSQFVDKLKAIQSIDIHEQGNALAKDLEDWRGTEEQVDDILVIGIQF